MPVNQLPIICLNLEESSWNTNSWPSTTVSVDKKITKKKSKEKYLLKDDMFQDLVFQPTPIFGGYVGHLYNERDIEKRAWEIYGGPSGLEARRKQLAAGKKAKWLSGNAATNYKEASVAQSKPKKVALSAKPSSPRPQRIDFPILQYANTATATIKNQKTPPSAPASQHRHLQSLPARPSKKIDLGIIDISSDSDEGLVKLKIKNQIQQPSSPTVVGSSPISKVRKRHSVPQITEVIDISSSEDEPPAKKRRIASSDPIFLSD